MVNPASTTRVVCLGDPVLDILANVTYKFLEEIDASAGGCIAVSPDDMAALLDRAGAIGQLTRVAGGSAANVAKALAGLLPQASYEVVFAGMVGNDNTAREYQALLLDRLVQPALVACPDQSLPTATCCCLVTPDGQRTMRTSLGAALQLTSADLLPTDLWKGATALHCEGYTLYKADMAEAAMRKAHALHMQVSLDLASFELVHNCGDALMRVLKEGLVDVVFCNEEEALAVLGLVSSSGDEGDSDDAVRRAQDVLLQHVQVVVVSRGAKGCSARSRSGEAGTSPACMVQVVDTVGAGDYFTGGFMAAYLQGASLQQAAVCGCVSGTAAVQSQGAMLTKEATLALQQNINKVLHNL